MNALLRTAAFCGAVGAVTLLLGRLGRDEAPRCDLDGVRLTGTFVARLESPPGTPRAFCSVRCAHGWTRRVGGKPYHLRVRDETTGADIDEADAWFARSTVLASRASGERIHAFARRSDAEAHVASYGGRLLEDDERPFRR